MTDHGNSLVLWKCQYNGANSIFWRSPMARAFSEIAYTPTVLAMQARQGSAASYAKFLTPQAPRNDRLGQAESAFIAARDGFYQATISETGWPYVQFRGGPKGFLRVIDEKT